jgi:hypothetical protein
MVNLLLTMLLIGAAVTYVLELLDELLLGFFDKGDLNKFLSLPLSLGGIFIYQGSWNLKMIVTVPATTFVSLVMVKFINKPQVQYQRLPRL